MTPPGLQSSTLAQLLTALVCVSSELKKTIEQMVSKITTMVGKIQDLECALIGEKTKSDNNAQISRLVTTVKTLQEEHDETFKDVACFETESIQFDKLFETIVKHLETLASRLEKIEEKSVVPAEGEEQQTGWISWICCIVNTTLFFNN